MTSDVENIAPVELVTPTVEEPVASKELKGKEKLPVEDVEKKEEAAVEAPLNEPEAEEEEDSTFDENKAEEEEEENSADASANLDETPESEDEEAVPGDDDEDEEEEAEEKEKASGSSAQKRKRKAKGDDDDDDLFEAELGDADPEELAFLDTKNIINTGRRTRGKRIDYTAALNESDDE